MHRGIGGSVKKTEHRVFTIVDAMLAFCIDLSPRDTTRSEGRLLAILVQVHPYVETYKSLSRNEFICAVYDVFRTYELECMLYYVNRCLMRLSVFV